MCVIIYKPAHVALPTDSILKTCWDHNPDGAGLAIMGNDSVTIDKGFMDLSSFMDFVKTTVKPEYAVVYHFRIATSGGINPQACHPFPVSNKVKDLRALHINTDRAFIHNGVISQGSKDLSDTQLYIRDILSKYISKGLPTDTRQKRIADDTIGSRTVLMDAKAHDVFLTGNWLADKETGLMFSNDSYKERAWDGWAFGNDPLAEDFCPHCGQWGELISPHWDLYECPECHTLFNGNGDVIATGEVSYEF